MQQNLTSGSVFQNVVRFSLPYLLSYFLQTLYGMADLSSSASLRPLPRRPPSPSARRSCTCSP
ncbi:MAG: hypothetical protein ACLR8U_02920 [Oscillospiraceae bacterium]